MKSQKLIMKKQKDSGDLVSEFANYLGESENYLKILIN